jgi:hypothetical protein
VDTRGLGDSDVVSAPGADDAGWAEYGERIVAIGVCVYCGEDIDQWEIRVEPEIQVRRPVLLRKHRVDGAVLCGRSQPATPAERG